MYTIWKHYNQSASVHCDELFDELFDTREAAWNKARELYDRWRPEASDEAREELDGGDWSLLVLHETDCETEEDLVSAPYFELRSPCASQVADRHVVFVVPIVDGDDEDTGS